MADYLNCLLNSRLFTVCHSSSGNIRSASSFDGAPIDERALQCRNISVLATSLNIANFALSPLMGWQMENKSEVENPWQLLLQHPVDLALLAGYKEIERLCVEVLLVFVRLKDLECRRTFLLLCLFEFYDCLLCVYPVEEGEILLGDLEQALMSAM